MSETLCTLFSPAGIHSVFASNRIYCFVGTDVHLEEVVICLFALLLCVERAAGTGSQADFKGGAWKATSGELQVGKRQNTGAKSLSLQEHHPLYLCQCSYIHGGHLESAGLSGKQIKNNQKRIYCLERRTDWTNESCPVMCRNKHQVVILQCTVCTAKLL